MKTFDSIQDLENAGYCRMNGVSRTGSAETWQKLSVIKQTPPGERGSWSASIQASRPFGADDNVSPDVRFECMNGCVTLSAQMELVMVTCKRHGGTTGPAPVWVLSPQAKQQALAEANKLMNQYVNGIAL
jgi:hypothetical protein